MEGLLSSHPAVEVTRIEAGWGEGVRTNYEAKYEREGRSILRLQAIWRPRSTDGFFHPRGEAGILAATRTRIE